ncbi:hypothetical protein ACLXAZ_32700, partial [Escherichia coli]
TLAGILGPMIAVRFMLSTIGIRLPGLIGLLKLLFAPIRMLAGLLIGPLVTALRVVSSPQTSATCCTTSASS